MGWIQDLGILSCLNIFAKGSFTFEISLCWQFLTSILSSRHFEDNNNNKNVMYFLLARLCVLKCV
jgi:hypothetical protein